MTLRFRASALALVLLGNGMLAVCGDQSAAQPVKQELTSLAGGWKALANFDSNGKLHVCMALRLPDKNGMMFGAFTAPAGELPAAVASPDSEMWGVVVRSDSWQLELGEKPRSVDITFDAQAQYHVSAFVEDKQTLLIPTQADEIARQFRKSYAMSIAFEQQHFDFSLAGTFRLLPVLTNCLRTSSIKGPPAEAPIGRFVHNFHPGPTAGQTEKDCDQTADADRQIAACSQLLAGGGKLTAQRRFLYHLNRALGYREKGDDNSALADYDAASVLDPESYLVFLGRGSVYQNKGKLDLALTNYNAAILRAPKYSYALVGRGEVYAKTGELDRALADFDRAIRINPKDYDAYSGRGGVYLDQGNYDRALADYDAAIRLDSSQAFLYGERAVVHARRGDHGIAIADAQQAVRLEPKTADAHAVLAFAFAKTGDFGRAQSEIDEAFRLGSKNANAFLYRGEIYLLKREPQLALKDFEDALALRPYSVFAKAGREAAQLALTAPMASLSTAATPVAVAPMQAGLPATATAPIAVRTDATTDSLSTFFGEENVDFRVFPQNTLQSVVRKPTPLAIPSATTLTTMELKKAIDGGRPVVLIDAFGDDHAMTIKGAVALPYAGTFGTFQDQLQTRLSSALKSLLQGRADASLIFFCGGVNCWESYNAALRAHAAGFQNISWYRGGLAAWKEAGFPMQPNQ
jgi:PQQ-dependent catabolism-associated CXXCW motif protein